MSCNCENDKKETPGFSGRAMIKSVKSVIKSAVKTIVDPTYDPYVTTEIRNARLRQCYKCDALVPTMLGKPRCAICTCFVDAKVVFKDQFCEHPEGSKWKQEP